MSIDTGEGQPKSVIDRINALQEQQIQSGELRKTPIGTFHYPYLKDLRYQNADPEVKAAIEQLNIPDLTVTETEKAVIDLKIREKLTVTTIIPTSEEERHIIPSLGIGGRAISPTEARYYFDPTHPKVVESLKEWKERQVAHETNHLARLQTNKPGVTLLDALISEGLATYYEEHWKNIYQPTPWGHVLSAENLTREWNQARLDLLSPRYNHGEWFFGQNGKHSVWTGYSLGTAIVDGYMSKHPQCPMSQLVRKPSIEILNKSGFST